jgi:hypothetical protein
MIDKNLPSRRAYEMQPISHGEETREIREDESLFSTGERNSAFKRMNVRSLPWDK